MTATHRTSTGDTHPHYDDAAFADYCDGLEAQYTDAKANGVFEILTLLDVDKAHSDSHLVHAIDDFNATNGQVEETAPVAFLTEREKNNVHENGQFRPELYCMLLSSSVARAIENKSLFFQHSLQFAFDES